MLVIQDHLRWNEGVGAQLQGGYGKGSKKGQFNKRKLRKDLSKAATESYDIEALFQRQKALHLYEPKSYLESAGSGGSASGSILQPGFQGEENQLGRQPASEHAPLSINPAHEAGATE